MVAMGRSKVRTVEDDLDGLPLPPVATMGEVEERILNAEAELAELTHTHQQLAEEAADAEADWKAHLGRVILRVHHSGERTAVDVREAMARDELDPYTGHSGEDLYRQYKRKTASAESSARAMRALEARGGMFQTLAANIRKVT